MGDGDVSRERELGGIGILWDVDQRLAPVEVQAYGGADALNDGQCSSKILRKAHEGAFIKVPDIEREVRDLQLDTLNKGVEVRASPKGPRGSPHCTPQQLWMKLSPRRRRD